jgi:hypothetical protein
VFFEAADDNFPIQRTQHTTRTRIGENNFGLLRGIGEVHFLFAETEHRNFLERRTRRRNRIAPGLGTMTSWRLAGDLRVAVKCRACKYGVTFLKPGPSSVFWHCGKREAIPQEVLDRLNQRRIVLAQVAAALAVV